jgi:hypothetical protein
MFLLLQAVVPAVMPLAAVAAVAVCCIKQADRCPVVFHTQ